MSLEDILMILDFISRQYVFFWVSKDFKCYYFAGVASKSELAPTIKRF